MSKIKKVPNNLNGRRAGTESDLVDSQIILWRRRMAKSGRVLGRHMRRQKEKNRKRLEENAKGDPTKRKWF